MSIKINGVEEILANEAISILDLFRIKEVKMPDMVSVQLNEEFVKKEKYASIKLKTGDNIDFLYFMGGGK